MALVIKDRVKETTTTTGTGTYTLAGAEVGFQSFSTIGNGNTTYYAVTNNNDWEVGIGTYTSSGTTLARTTILSSSNSNNAVNWSSGEKYVIVTQPSSKASFLDASGDLNLSGDIVVSGTVDGRNLSADGTKVDYISVTQAVNLDEMETDIAALANGMVYKGDWDASSGSFPSGAQTGWFYYVSVAGTVNSIAFHVGDNLVATTDNASTSTYASNWSKHDQTDAVQAVVGLTGSISKSGLLSALNVEDGADVTDATNVTAAGALMDSEVTNLAQVKAFDSSDYATAAQGTTADAALPKSGGTLTGNATFGDNNKVIFGTGSDLQIYHDSSTNKSHITESGSSHLIIQGQEIQFKNASGVALMDLNSAQVELRYSGTKKMETNNEGITVTGDIAVTGTVDGVDIATNIPASLGTAGQVLTVNSGASAGEWVDAGGGASEYTIDNKTLAYTVVSGDLGKILNYTSGTVDVTLTALSSLTTGFHVSIWNSGTGVISIKPNSVDGIGVSAGNDYDSTDPLKLERGTGVTLVNSGTYWQIYSEKAYDYYHHSVTLGANAKVTNNNAMALGNRSYAASAGAIAIGTGQSHATTASNQHTVAIGLSTASGAGAIALGKSSASGADSFAAAIDNNSTSYGASGANSVAIGYTIRSTGEGAVALGSGSVASGQYSFSTGYQSSASGTNSVAMGRYNVASGDFALTFGNSQSASASNSIAIGGNNTVSHENAIALGKSIQSTASNQVSIGGTTQDVRISEVYTLPKVDGTNGQVLTTDGSGAVTFADAGGGADLYAANESSPSAQPSATGTNAIAIGDGAISSNTNSVALAKSRASGSNGFAASINSNSTSYGASGNGSIAMGQFAKGGSSGTAIGSAFAHADGSQSVAIGRNVYANHQSSVALGYGAISDVQGKFAYAGYKNASNGDSQFGLCTLRISTTDATATVMKTTAVTSGVTAINQMTLPNNSAHTFSGTIVAREKASEGTDVGAWEVKGIIRREATAGTTVLVNSVINELNVPTGWAVALTADTTLGCLKVAVTGVASTNIRWVATIQTSEVTYS